MGNNKQKSTKSVRATGRRALKADEISIREYDAFIKPLDKYPKSVKPYVYALGLTEEAGEAAGKLKKVIRDTDGKLDKSRKQAVMMELGDTLWYLTRFAAHLGYSLEQVMYYNVKKLKDRQSRGVLAGGGKILSGDNR